jgi:polyhydroxyalkanoate synthase
MTKERQFPSLVPTDPAKLADARRRLIEIAEKTKELTQVSVERHQGGREIMPLDPTVMGRAFCEFTAGLLSNPVKLAEAQMKLWQDYAGIWQNLTRRALGEEVPPYVQPAPGDRRFKDDAWTNELVYDFLKQSYLVGSRWIQGLVAETPGVNERTRAEIQFLTRQYIDAIAPTNFVLTNPVVARKTMETGGANLLAGMSNFLDDLTRNNALVKNRAPETFKVGVNIAATPGSVIYQNDLMQLIQYNPSTKDVSKTPILFVPPWVNKYYLFDLQPKNSFLKWLVDQGHTVFAISWVNPGKRHRDKDFVDYMKEGPLAALDAIEQATGEREAHVVAYCLGGTLTATMLAWQAARNDTRVKSATLLATLTEFSDLGEFSVFFDEDRLLKLDRYLEKKGFLEGHDLARLFSIVRANDLIWSAVVNNYLLAEESLPFDMTYWFADPAHMPAKMLNFYIRNIVFENRLPKPGQLVIDGVPIDLGKIKTPTCFVSMHDDHVAPWRATYSGPHLFGGPTRFILGGSGHNAGIVNPPVAKKHGYWTNPELPPAADDWLAGATRHEGSWWPEWASWLAAADDGKVPARVVGAGALKPLEAAPGSYVKVRA